MEVVRVRREIEIALEYLPSPPSTPVYLYLYCPMLLVNMLMLQATIRKGVRNQTLSTMALLQIGQVTVFGPGMCFSLIPMLSQHD